MDAGIPLDWRDASDNSNSFKQSYVRGFLDVSGGSIITRGTTGRVAIGGDASLNGAISVGGKLSVQTVNSTFPLNVNGATDISGNMLSRVGMGVNPVLTGYVNGNPSSYSVIPTGLITTDVSLAANNTFYSPTNTTTTFTPPPTTARSGE
jgi:hypothetical protein